MRAALEFLHVTAHRYRLLCLMYTYDSPPLPDGTNGFQKSEVEEVGEKAKGKESRLRSHREEIHPGLGRRSRGINILHGKGSKQSHILSRSATPKQEPG